MAEQALNVAQTETLFEQMRREAVAQRVYGDFFLIPHCCTTAFIAAWAPPRSMAVVAFRMRSGEPTALGNNKRGWRCLHHKARKAAQVRSGNGTRRSLWPLPRRICTC